MEIGIELQEKRHVPVADLAFGQGRRRRVVGIEPAGKTADMTDIIARGLFGCVPEGHVGRRVVITLVRGVAVVVERHVFEELEITTVE